MSRVVNYKGPVFFLFISLGYFYIEVYKVLFQNPFQISLEHKQKPFMAKYFSNIILNKDIV